MKIIIGNWKMNGNAEMLDEMVSNLAAVNTENRVILCVPATLLRPGTGAVMIGAQNVSKYESGAHTGDISANLVSATGASVTLVGHSECREAQHDTNADVARRAELALNNDIMPIICVGETATERENGKIHEIIERGVRESIPHNATNGGFIIAYEPRWAIGTGITASGDEIANAHKIIRSILNEMGFDETPVLYGGSVTAINSAEIMKIDHVDGVLVGGASLKKDDFIPIITSIK